MEDLEEMMVVHKVVTVDLEEHKVEMVVPMVVPMVDQMVDQMVEVMVEVMVVPMVDQMVVPMVVPMVEVMVEVMVDQMVVPMVVPMVVLDVRLMHVFALMEQLSFEIPIITVLSLPVLLSHLGLEVHRVHPVLAQVALVHTPRPLILFFQVQFSSYHTLQLQVVPPMTQTMMKTSMRMMEIQMSTVAPQEFVIILYPVQEVRT